MWKDWLAFSRKEQYGIIVLAVLILLLVALRLLLPVFDEPPGIIVSDTSRYFEFDSAKIRKSRSSFNGKASQKAFNFQVFNPNKVSVTALSRMGLPSYVIVNWIKYLEAGGHFYSATDVRKVYGLDSVTVNVMLPFLSFKKNDSGKQYFVSKLDKSEISGEPVEETKEKFFYSGEKEEVDKKEKLKIEINEATAEKFRRLVGIGDVLSERIVAFRQALGGFYKIGQIKEVYGISDELFLSIKDNLIIEKRSIRRIDVNHASLRTLKAHPYINFYQARDIIEYRKKKFRIENSEVLKTFASFDEQSLEKVLPYMSFGKEEKIN